MSEIIEVETCQRCQKSFKSQKTLTTHIKKNVMCEKYYNDNKLCTYTNSTAQPKKSTVSSQIPDFIQKHVQDTPGYKPEVKKEIDLLDVGKETVVTVPVQEVPRMTLELQEETILPSPEEEKQVEIDPALETVQFDLLGSQSPLRSGAYSSEEESEIPQKMKRLTELEFEQKIQRLKESVKVLTKNEMKLKTIIIDIQKRFNESLSKKLNVFIEKDEEIKMLKNEAKKLRDDKKSMYDKFKGILESTEERVSELEEEIEILREKNGKLQKQNEELNEFREQYEEELAEKARSSHSSSEEMSEEEESESSESSSDSDHKYSQRSRGKKSPFKKTKH